MTEKYKEVCVPVINGLI